MIPIAKPLLGKEEADAALEVLSKSQIAAGEYVTKFEHDFKTYLSCSYAICTNNGTTALHTALVAAGIGRDDLVITTPYSFIATANAILYVGAKPLFADVDKSTFNINPDSIEELIRNTPGKIKALVIVHLFGNPCDMDRILEICNKYEILLIEDCAQAHGAEYNNKKVGTFGLVSIFSFYPTKNMTCGEGGMIATNNEEIYREAKKIINHGQEQRYVHDMLGYNYRLTNLAAAIGIEQLKKLDNFNDKRISNAERYISSLSQKKYSLPPVKNNIKHVYNQFTLNCKIGRDKVIEALEQSGIGYGLYYPLTIPEQPLYKNLKLDTRCPIAQNLSRLAISIPVHPGVSKVDIGYIVEALNNV
ncbi:MAG: hypothetical protein A2Y23_10165 [Clostridiales bacterium GWB2_37_7]|nr:MAG: hypothetical protein A2Y23_10165 [Clostridiales bacterium GWB2_37_7]